MSNTLDEIDEILVKFLSDTVSPAVFHSEGARYHKSHAKAAIQALISEARIDEISKLHDDDVLMSENHIRALEKAIACLAQLKENKQ